MFICSKLYVEILCSCQLSTVCILICLSTTVNIWSTWQMAPKEEICENGNATDGMTTQEKMVDVSPKQKDVLSAGKICNSIINHSEVPVTEICNEVSNDESTIENDALCKKMPIDAELDPCKDEKESHDTLNPEDIMNKEENGSLKPLELNGSEDTENGSYNLLDESTCTKDNSVMMRLCVSVSEDAVLPPDLWHAAVKKEPVNVWILQVSDGDFSSDSKVSSPLQIVFPWEHSWSWDSQLDPASSEEDEPPTYTTLQTVNWDDTTSCHSGQLKDASQEGAGSSGFSDDEEMSSVTGENFNLLGSDSGLQTSSSDGDLRMMQQSGICMPEDSWSEDANTFALTELRLGSDADSRCSIDTDRQTDPPASLPASGPHERFSCSLCHKTFTDQLNFKYHKRTHKDRKLFTCDLCNQKFAREKTLERHRLTHSVPVQPPVLECPACPETFEQRTQLRIHMRAMHRDEPIDVVDSSGTRKLGPFTCEICRKTFAHATRLKHHQAAHYERQYNCHICSVTLATKHSLRRHLYIHSGEKPFGCDICGKAFAFELYLRNHMKKHLSFKLHDCAFCPEQFYSRRELKAHLQSHRGRYHCQVCQENFRSKHKLKEHMQSHES